MKELQGKWNYQSFCSFAAVADRSAAPPASPKVLRPTLLAGPWTPPSIMEFATDSDGKVTGSAELGPLKLVHRQIKCASHIDRHECDSS